MMVIILFYHLETFQQCLTCCKLDSPGLHALVDSYQGCFLNIATDGSERRFFAGIYLLFRFLYNTTMTVLAVTMMNMFEDQWNTFSTSCAVAEMFMAIVMAGIVLIWRPYKNIFHNAFDLVVFLFMCPIPFLCTVYSFYLGQSYSSFIKKL